MATHVKTYDMVGKKEQVDDIISLIEPTDTPFLTSVKSEKVKGFPYQWLEDQLRAVADNAHVEGFEAVDSDRDQPEFVSNTTQILSETFRVSGTADVVDAYGRATETARELAKTGKLLKMDLEHALVGTKQTKVDGNASTARKFAGVQAQIHADTTIEAPDGDSGAGGTQTSPLTEVLVTDALEKLYDNGGEGSTLMVKPSDTRVIAGFPSADANSDRTRDMGQSTTYVNVINVLKSPFGEVKVVMNRRMATDNALIYNPSSWRLCVLRPWFKEVLAKTGDSTRHMVVGEYGLKHRNRRMSALITNLS